MIPSDLTPEHKNFLMNVLDKGLDQFSYEDISPPAFHKSPETPKSKGFPSYETSVQNIPKRQSSVVGRIPTETIQSLTMQKELLGLQEKLATLESKLSTNSKSPKLKLSSSFTSKQSRNSGLNLNLANRISSESASSRRSSIDNHKGSFKRSRESSLRSSRSNSRLRSIEQSEREIKNIERSVRSSPLSRDFTINRQIDKVRDELQIERRRQAKLKRENETLKESLIQRETLQIKLIKLQEDYNETIITFERSENIRKKQKDMIEALKEEILISSDLPNGLKSITIKPPVCKVQRKAPIRRTKKEW